jgi:hypothetical protein
MQKFFKNIIVFVAGFIPLILIAMYIYVRAVDVKYIPPVRISNSVSFNDKILFCHKKMANTLSIGSSMTLNNIHSESIVNFLKSDSYLNMGSWGLCIEDVYVMLKEYSKVKMPQTVFLTGSMEDFAKREIKYDNSDDIHKILTTDYMLFYYLKYPDVKYYITGVTYYKFLKELDTTYESLKYDKYGQVKYPTENFDLNLKRWNHVITNTILDEKNYAYLDSIAIFSHRNNIRLYYVQTPVRKGLADSLNKNKLERHSIRVQNILKKYNNLFVDTNDKTWDDSLFTDATHMNCTGAKIFTDYFIDKIKIAASASIPSAQKK